MKRGPHLVLLGCLVGAPLLGAADRPEAWNTFLDVPMPSLPRAEILSPETPDLTLVWFDPQEAFPVGFEIMAREVQTIFGNLDVKVAWKRGALGTTFGEGATPELAVILLPADPVRERQRDRVMGLVAKKQGPNRSLWVFLSNVKWTLGFSTRDQRSLSAKETLQVGRALGRVVAHEVIHAISPEEPHARGGLMEHSLRRSFLVDGEVALEARCARAFLTSLAARPVEGP